jgi:hypothetical protein
VRRKPHILRENHRTTTPAECIFVDTEATITPTEPGVERHTLRMGYALYWHRRHGRGADTQEGVPFRTVEDFWALVERRLRPKHCLYLFAHNWNYDAGILGVSTWIKEQGWNVLSYVNERPPLIIKLRRYVTTRTDVEEAPEDAPRTLLLVTPDGVRRVEKATVTQLARDGLAQVYHLRVLDSLNFFGQALSALGSVLGMEKGEIADFRTATDEELAPYNERDTRILADMMVRYFEFIEQHDMGNFAPTLAGQAFNAFRHGFMREDIYIHDNEPVCTLERDAYHGGRTECFTIGVVREPLYYLDVNSLYPSVMLTGRYPVRLVSHGEVMGLADVRRVLGQGYGIIADCLVDTPEPVYAKVDEGERLIFPVGSFWTALTTPEIEYGLAHQLIRQVQRWAIYEMAPIYHAYVKAFYQMRLDFRAAGNEPYAYIVKGLLNSLYGKTGQKGLVYENLGIAGEQTDGIWIHLDEQGERHQRRIRLGQIQELVREQETRESFPAIAAHVTAEARMKMWALYTRAGLENVHYTDTDSLIVNRVGYERLLDQVDPSILGLLKLEEEAAEAIFRGPKDYTFGETTSHIKGISKRARKVQHDLYEQDQFVSWDRIAARGEDGYIEVRRITKRLERRYRKGYVPPEGGRVAPIRFHNDFSYGIRRLDSVEEIEEERRSVARRAPSEEREDYLGSLDVLREAVIASTLTEEQREQYAGLLLERTRLEDQIDALATLRRSIERPSWASGLSYQTILAIARHEERNPYQPDWGDSIDPVVVREFREGARGASMDEPRRLRRDLRGVQEQIRALEALARKEQHHGRTAGDEPGTIPQGARV